MRLVLLVPTLALALACDSKSDAAPAKSDAKPEAKSGVKTDAPAKTDAKSDAPAKSDASATPTASAAKLELSTSSGAGLSGVVPTECTIGADGKGVVKADDGKFELTFEGTAGKLKWTYTNGALNTDTTVSVTGKSLRFNGMHEGVGYDGEVTCP